MADTFPDNPKVLISSDQISGRVKELGRQITQDYSGKPLVMIGVLTGAIIFLSDLIRQIDLPIVVDLMRAASYGKGTESSGRVHLLKDIETNIEAKDVLIIEDIVDSGKTLHYLLETLALRRPASLRVCALLSKPARREVPVEVTYSGFEIPDVYVVGYGLDLDGRYRHLPYIGVLG